MIKNNFVNILKKGCRKLEYFKKLGYDIDKEILQINIKDLTIGSREIVDVLCDFCENEVSITYREYLRNISLGGKYSCCKICGAKKAKETNLKKYGVEHPLQLEEFQKKQKETNLEKYGVEYLQQSKDIKLKSKKTLINKYDVEHISQTKIMKKKSSDWMKSDEFKEKSKKTLMKNYGVENPTQSIDINKKIKETLSKYTYEDWKIISDKIKITKLIRYGNKNYNNIEKIKENYNNLTDEKKLKIIDNIKNTKLIRYGNKNYNNIEKIKETLSKFTYEDWKIISNKIKETNLKEYGVDNIVKDENFRKENFKIAKHPNYIKYIENNISSFKCINGHYFEIKSDNFYKRLESNLPLCTICYPIDDLKSIKEKQLLEFIKSFYKGEILSGYRDVLEIDIYLPELKFGIEFNGLYWHSNEFKENNYHLNKTLYFMKNGIRIMHIFEDDWDLKQDIIKSQIKNVLGLTENKIFARKCKIRELYNIKNFLNENHIQGSDKSLIKLGLYFNDELISVMTFDNFEGRKKMEKDGWNLSRFCNKLNYNVVGGASKLLNYFIKNYNPLRIISYADRIWSEGNLYYKLGFKLISETNPDYKYIIENKRIHKSNFKKTKLNTQLTESLEMKNRGINKIYDCGKLKFELINI